MGCRILGFLAKEACRFILIFRLTIVQKGFSFILLLVFLFFGSCLKRYCFDLMQLQCFLLGPLFADTVPLYTSLKY